MAEGPIEVDPGQRVVVNSDFDTNNIASMDKMKDHIIHALDVCIDILKAHCGPQAGYAMLVNSMGINQSFEPNIFTRDGIRILSSVEFMSPLEKYIKDMLTYVGARVDNKAKDGTTTSMLVAALFLKAMLSNRDVIKELGLSLYEFKEEVSKLFKYITDELTKYSFKVEELCEHPEDEEELMKAAGKVAFIQALSSSGGNLELALAMKEIFEKSPKVTWEFITSHNSIKEDGKAFSVEVDEYDSRIRCILATDQGLNHALNTQYLEEDVNILVYPYSLDNMSIDTDEVLKYIEHIPEDQAFCLITQHVDAKIVVGINSVNQKRKKPIVIWQYAPEHKLAGQNYPWELLLLCAIAGVEPLNFKEIHTLEDQDIIHAKKVNWHDTYLDIFGVIDLPEGSCLHPYYVHKEKATKFYNDVRLSIETEIDKYRQGKNPDGKMLSIFIEMLNRLATVKRPTLRCGGPVHEQIANKDVVQDVQGAIMSSLNNGFIINGVFSLLSAIHQVDINLHKEENVGNTSPLITYFISYMVLSLLDIISVLFGADESIDQKFLTMSVDKELYTNVFSKSENDIKISNFGGYLEYLNQLSNDDIDLNIVTKFYPVMQPLDITKELLKRINELIMKVVNTDKIIVYGGVIINKKEEEE